MKKSVFTIEDVKEFLSQQGYLEWTGYIYDYKTNEKIYATIDDFVNSKHSTIALEFLSEDDATVFVDMCINNFLFETYIEKLNTIKTSSSIQLDRDLSKQWQSFLIKKYTEEYALMLFDWSVDNMTNIEFETREKIKNFSKQENDKASKSIAKFNESAKEAMKYISDEYIQNFDTNIF